MGEKSHKRKAERDAAQGLPEEQSVPAAEGETPGAEGAPGAVESGAAEVPPEPETTVEGLSEVLAQKEEELAQLRQQALYQHAEVENFKKRTEKRYREMLAYASEPLLKELLPVLDNLERALEHGGETGPDGYGALLEGLGHVVQQFGDVLKAHGVEAVPTDGVRFDPSVHEAVAQMPGPEDGLVGIVCEKGYSYRERLLRPAKVLVTKVAPVDHDG